MLILSINWTNAFIVTSLGLVIVFIVLCLLILLMNSFGVIARKTEKKQSAAEGAEELSDVVSGKESAAITMALYLYYDDVHDEESDIITIKNANNRYSPWSSKIYGVNNY